MVIKYKKYHGLHSDSSTIEKIRKNTGIYNFCVKNDVFLDFSRYGSWRPLDVCKRMSEDVRAFSTIGELILRTSLFGPFLTPPPYFLAAELTGRGANGVESMVGEINMLSFKTCQARQEYEKYMDIVPIMRRTGRDPQTPD